MELRPQTRNLGASQGLMWEGNDMEDAACRRGRFLVRGADTPI